MTDEVPLSETEKAEIREALGYGSGMPDSKHNVHTFLFNVATAQDTTKLGYLKDEEIGMLPNPIRSYKHLEQFAADIMGKKELGKFFGANSEIVTSTSLSRAGFLVDRAVIQKRELKDTTMKPRKENSSWFKKKNNNDKEEEQ